MTATPTLTLADPRFANAEQWHENLGRVPLRRVIFDPLPGTATEADMHATRNRLGCWSELIDGTLVERPGDTWNGVIAADLSSPLFTFIEQNKLGLFGNLLAPLRTTPTRVRLLTAFFVHWDDLPGRRVQKDYVVDGPIRLAADFVMDDHAPAELAIKRRECFGVGARLVWQINPGDQSVDVYRSADGPPETRSGTDALDGGDVLPGFVLPLSDLFESCNE